MALPIKGLEKTSLVDYPGKIAATIFLGNCNFRCPYCHNKDLVIDFDKHPNIPEKEIIEYLIQKRKWIDGVCISGGEPLMHNDIIPFIQKIKKLGFLVKMDTNGSNPLLLKKLIDEKLLDYIAMDIKSSIDNYDIVARVKVNKENVLGSARIIMDSKVKYEFRSTIVPGLFTAEDAEKIGLWLKGAKNLYLQQFRKNPNVIDSTYKDKKPFNDEEIESFKKILEKNIKNVEVRNN